MKLLFLLVCASKRRIKFEQWWGHEKSRSVHIIGRVWSRGQAFRQQWDHVDTTTVLLRLEYMLGCVSVKFSGGVGIMSSLLAHGSCKEEESFQLTAAFSELMITH
jgi:hypothetical protein